MTIENLMKSGNGLDRLSVVFYYLSHCSSPKSFLACTPEELQKKVPASAVESVVDHYSLVDRV